MDYIAYIGRLETIKNIHFPIRNFQEVKLHITFQLGWGGSLWFEFGLREIRKSEKESADEFNYSETLHYIQGKLGYVSGIPTSTKLGFIKSRRGYTQGDKLAPGTIDVFHSD
ncbi:hypothetical protein RF11_14839 [Thelohanellus kitauei]|uniref:Uncharacterized protein n=1 Tax=Thelohanellus kitauei TaxID=669202 RepID=A0A0C2N9D3_THEKT|nr:hypothetical protein RF11_14839 [Thelohanellus kitauei]